MRRTKAEADKTRENIRKKAEELFAAHGVDGVSLEQIAAAAGVTRGSLHFHFHNKAGLLDAILANRALPIRQLVESLETATDLMPLDSLLESCARVFSQLRDDPIERGLLRTITLADAGSPDGGESARKRFSKQLRDLSEKMFAMAERRSTLASPWTPRTASLALVATMSGFIDDWVMGADDIAIYDDGMAMVRALVATMRRAA